MDGAMALVNADPDPCRLCLVTPPGATPETFGTTLEAALAGGEVASLIVTAAPGELDRLAAATVPLAQAHGVAALIHNDREIALNTGADGVHIDDRRDDLAALVAALHPDRIAGIGNLTSRHDAMSAGEAQPDYVFFGRLDGDNGAAIFPKAFDLAEWWSALFEIPAVVMGGADLASVRQASKAGIEFVALRRAVWEHPDGPGAAVAAANRLLVEMQDAAP
jgi:thiamine-phosphate pyrophosphorylase